MIHAKPSLPSQRGSLQGYLASHLRAARASIRPRAIAVVLGVQEFGLELSRTHFTQVGTGVPRS